MRVVRAYIRLEGQVQQLPVQVLLLLLQRDVLVLVHRGQERPRPGQSVPGVIQVGWYGVGGRPVRRQGGGRGGGRGGGVQQERSGVVDVGLQRKECKLDCIVIPVSLSYLSGEPSNWIHLAGKMIILIIR